MDTAVNVDIWINFGKYVKTSRMMLGLTQEELAKKVGISESELRKIEKGEARLEVQTFFEFDKIFGPNIFYFLMQSYYEGNEGRTFDGNKAAAYNKLLQDFRRSLCEYNDSCMQMEYSLSCLNNFSVHEAGNRKLSSSVCDYEF